MYHLELRKFPHNRCHFNLGEEELMRILVPWVRGEWVRIGDRTWNAHDARLSILEGPQLEPGQLTMGRGWRTAQRQGADVTRAMLESAGQRHAGAAPAPVRQAMPPAAGEPVRSGTGEAGKDAGVPRSDLLTLLGGEAERLLAAWLRASARLPNRPPSETLAAAEGELAATDAQEARARSG